MAARMRDGGVDKKKAMVAPAIVVKTLTKVIRQSLRAWRMEVINQIRK